MSDRIQKVSVDLAEKDARIMELERELASARRVAKRWSDACAEMLAKLLRWRDVSERLATSVYSLRSVERADADDLAALHAFEKLKEESK